MVAMDHSASQARRSELQGLLQKLMLLRLLFVSLLLGLSVALLARETRIYFGPIQTAHYVLIASLYFLTFIYALLLKYGCNLLWLAYFQIIADTFLVTAIVYTTGGIESYFSFLYMLVIINGSILLYRKGGIVTASSSSILYGLLLDLDYYRIVHPLGSTGAYGAGQPGFHVFNLIAVSIAAFYLVAWLSSYLSEQIRKNRQEIKARQTDIMKLEMLNDSIINSLTSGLIALDESRRIMLFNPAAEGIFGQSARDVKGQRLEEVLPFLGKWPAAEAHGPFRTPDSGSSPVDLTFEGKHGEPRQLRALMSPLIPTFGGQIGHLLFFQDMTDIRRIEEDMKRIEGLAMVGEIAAAMAHEIRNPMASISGSIQLLKDGAEKNGMNARLMDIVIREIDRLNRLIKDFQLFAKPRKAAMRPFDLNQLTVEAVELFKNSTHWNRNVRVLKDFRASILLESDPEQMRQVFWNLFLNASEAMPDGGTLEITLERAPAPAHLGGERARIIVRDTGKGFDERDLSKIFNPFFTTKAEGSGLGLSIVKGIVEGFGGEVHGRNHPAGGAMITVELPLRVPPGPLTRTRATAPSD
jgi:two-component system sensor histidine kinase PilS (NtrC family)